MSVTLEISDNNCWRQWNLIELMLTFSILQTFSNFLSKSLFSYSSINFFVPLCNPELLRALKRSNMNSIKFYSTVTNNSLLFNPFQRNVVFHIEIVIWFALQIMPGFLWNATLGWNRLKENIHYHRF